MKIAGTTALVTGDNRGIGEGFVEELLAQDAARVYVGSRDVTEAEAVAALDPDRVVVVELDITEQVQVDTAAALANDIRLLVNNAGVFHNTTLLGADDMTAMESEITVNYLGTMRMCRAFAPIIEANGGGAIVNVLSAGGIVAVPDMGGYSPSKFAMRAASDCLRAELAPKGVHVAALIVGSVETRMAEHVVGVHKEPPRAIAKAGLVAAKQSISEYDTDPFAIGVRAQLHRDPSGLAAVLAASVQQGG